VRRSERPARHQTLRWEEPGHAPDPTHLDRLTDGKRRQHRRQTAREECLAGAGRADEQQVVATGGGDLERPLRVRLSAHVGDVDLVGHHLGQESPGIGAHGRDRGFRVQERRRFGKGAHRVDAERLEHRRLRGVAGREEAAVEPGPARAERHREYPAHGMDRPVEGELSHHEETREPLRLDGTRRGQETERDWEVEADAFLSHVRRREIDRHPLERERETGVPDRRADPLPALPHGGIRQADRREHRQPLAHVDLDSDQRRLDAGEAGREHPGEHQRPGGRPSVDPVHGAVPRPEESTPSASASDGPRAPRMLPIGCGLFSHRPRSRSTLETIRGVSMVSTSPRSASGAARQRRGAAGRAKRRPA
jgi:hypothetical protein